MKTLLTLWMGLGVWTLAGPVAALADGTPTAPASQAEVNSGTLGTKYVSPKTLANWTPANVFTSLAVSNSPTDNLGLSSTTNGDTITLKLGTGNVVTTNYIGRQTEIVGWMTNSLTASGFTPSTYNGTFTWVNALNAYSNSAGHTLAYYDPITYTGWDLNTTIDFAGNVDFASGDTATNSFTPLYANKFSAVNGSVAGEIYWNATFQTNLVPNFDIVTTNAISATNSASGYAGTFFGVTENNFWTNGTLNAQPMPAPLYGWNAYGNDIDAPSFAPTENAVTNTEIYYNAIGLSKYIRYFMLDNGWSYGLRDANGNIVWVTNNFSQGIPWLANYTHTNVLGGKFWLWRKLNERDYAQQDAAYFTTNYMIDGISLDGGFADTSDETFQTLGERLIAAFREASIAARRPVAIHLNHGSYNRFDPFLAQADAWTVGFDGKTFGAPPLVCWTNFIQIFDSNAPAIPYMGNGHWFQFSTMAMFGASNNVPCNTNMLSAFLSQAAVAPMSFFLCQTSRIDGLTLPYLTNTLWYSLHQFGGARPGFRLLQNTNVEIWGRHVDLYGGSVALSFWNKRNDGISSPLTVTWQELNLAPNIQCAVRVVFTNGTTAPTSPAFTNAASITTTVNTNSANLFILTPIWP